MQTLGIDLSEQEAGTAACVVDWSAARPRISILQLGVSDAVIEGLYRDADVTAIDAPFGWPEGFVRAVSAFSHGQSWLDAPPSELWARLTDRRTHSVAGGPPPLSVSSDRIARTAARAARLLSMLGEHRPLARDGLDGVLEVYPAAALRLWKLARRGYKHRDAALAQPVRQQLIREICERLGLNLAAELREMLVSSHDTTDALVASLVGRAFLLGLVGGPASQEEWRAARTEGWIWLPTGTLEDLLAATPREPPIRRDRRGIPLSMTGSVGEPISLELPPAEPGCRWLVLPPDQITVNTRPIADGRWHVDLTADEPDDAFRVALVMASHDSDPSGERFDLTVRVLPGS